VTSFPDYGSHIPVLCRCFIELKEDKGNVLELGCGDFSTPILHELCCDRNLLTLDIDERWTNNVKHLGNYFHVIRKVDSWIDLPAYKMDWSLVLVDQSPGEYRHISVAALADRAKLLVLHDTESRNNIYGYYKVLDKFKYLVEYAQHPTKTIVASNFINVTGWW
jgi:hypothetical protein